MEDGAEDLTFLVSSRNPESRQRLDKHVVGYYTIQYMERGGVDLAYDEEWTRMECGETGWFWPAYPGPRLRFHAAPGYDHWFHRHIAFQGPRVQRWQASGLWPDCAQPAPPGRGAAEWGAYFEEMCALSQRPDRWGRLRAVNLLEGLLLALADARASAPAADAEDAWLAPVLERLESADAFAPDYAGLARAAGMGLSTLRRRFRAATGLSLHGYVLQARLSRARALLAETDLPLAAVAERLGYENVYFFARQFKQQVGVPPGVYRRSRQL